MRANNCAKNERNPKSRSKVIAWTRICGRRRRRLRRRRRTNRYKNIKSPPVYWGDLMRSLCAQQRVILGVYPGVTREIKTQITFEWAHKQFVTREHILYYFWYKESINDYKMTIFAHQPHVSVVQFTFCWWRHYKLLMTSQCEDNCDSSMWKVILNSLDIGFIDNDIPGFKKYMHWIITIPAPK